jgi:cytochrome b pre-mRNA-processing protein 3
VLGLLRNTRHERSGFELYSAAVAAARDPYFYTSLGVADTIDGRFDLVSLHAFLLIRRLNREPPAGPRLAQAIFDAMFSDMDQTLREIGVGDLSVGKKVKKMWEAFHGRCAAYEAALNGADPDALRAAIARNVWRGADPGAAADTLARVVRAQDAHLAAQPFAALAAGTASFLSPEAVPA